MKEYIKEYGALFLGSFVVAFVLGLAIGILLLSSRNQELIIVELEEQNSEMYQELIETKDTLNQIKMRNEAIKYIDELGE